MRGIIGEIMIRAACSESENTNFYVGNCKLANVGYARRFYEGDNFKLLQCVYPTKKNIYPWQDDWPEEISNLQPVLAETGLIFP